MVKGHCSIKKGMALEENVLDVKRKLQSAAGTGRVWYGWVFTAMARTGNVVSGQDDKDVATTYPRYHCIVISVEDLAFDE